jgi:Carboxypeptidase regulatory-like domain
MRFRSIVSSLAGAGVFLLASAATAQTTGSLSGQIVDANTQAPVADAVVIAQSPSLQGEQTAVTDTTGSFEITLLPAGVYALVVQREGYQPFTQQGLSVRLDRTIRVKLSLIPEALQAQAVEVVAQRPVIAVNSTQTGATISKEQMSIVPYGRNGRGFEQVASSVPGVQTDVYGLQINGAGSPESAYIIDGVMVNDPAYGTQGTTLVQDFVQEVDVKTGGFQAEYGRTSGGVLNVVTKSGGNEFHGSVFGNFTPLEASRNPVATSGSAGLALATRPSLRYNLDFGAELGGPILKDRLWFYAGFSPNYQSTNFDRIIQARQDNGSGQPVVDANGNPVFAPVPGGTQRYVQTVSSYQFTGKLTYLATENHTLALAIYGNPTTSSGANSTLGLNFLPTFNGNEGQYLFDIQQGATDVSLRYSGKLFNKTMLVEATGAYHHQYGASGSTPTINLSGIGPYSAAGMRDLPLIRWRQVHNLLDPAFDDGTLPSSQKNLAACQVHPNGFDPCPVNLYLSGGIGYDGNSTLDRIGTTLKLTNFVAGVAGHHQFKYGADLAWDKYDQTKFYTGGQWFEARSPVGVDTSQSGAPVSTYFGFRGYGHADPAHPGQPEFAANAPAGTIRLAGDSLHSLTRNRSFAAFLQDTWNIADKGLVLDAGVRIEKQLMYADPNTPDPNSPTGRVQSAGIDLTNVMPRLGLIYDFTGRGLSKVYASYGRFYEYVPLDLADRSLSAETSAAYSTNPGNCTNPHDPRTCALLPGGQGGGRTYTFTGGSAGSGVDPNLQGQYSDQFQGGVQYQAYRDITVGVDYVHNQLGRVVEDLSTDDGNTYFISNPGEPGKLGYQGTTGSGVTVVEPKPRRVYDGVTLSLKKEFSENYFLSASYTYSQFRGNFPGLFRPESNQLDPNNNSEYDLLSLLPNRDGPLPGDIPNAFKLDAGYLYEINSRTSVQVGGNLRANEGQPLNYLGAHPLYGPSEAFILPRGSGGRLPWNYQIDMRAALGYRFSKDYTAQFSVDLFNVTNAQAPTVVDQNYTFDSVSPIVGGSTKDLGYLKNTNGAPVSVNPTFLQPLTYQLPFSARFGAKLSF